MTRGLRLGKQSFGSGVIHAHLHLHRLGPGANGDGCIEKHGCSGNGDMLG
eukprot:m.87235 g.87235  ORF g.87235 m.87235 type:complete len:50 (+) comp16396_c1_seq8:232-381(+)